MRRPNEDHLARNFRVHALAQDFELLDVWRYPVEIDPDIPFEAFLEFLSHEQAEMLGGSGMAAQLFRLRAFLGRIFGWDGETPAAAREEAAGTGFLSVRERLAETPGGEADRIRSEISVAGEDRPIGFDPVYQDSDETLAEIRNATVHALMHLGRVPLEAGRGVKAGYWAPQMAVYVKPRGLFGRFYMAAISPFRHFIVYPAMMRAVARDWPIYAQSTFGPAS